MTASHRLSQLRFGTRRQIGNSSAIGLNCWKRRRIFVSRFPGSFLRLSPQSIESSVSFEAPAVVSLVSTGNPGEVRPHSGGATPDNALEGNRLVQGSLDIGWP